ncbi:hypothetical protein GWI33_023413 [Rhynchophorus ferrugineus]|uniref:Uncharacterized protein n=1 Tax=Rhynchophorus ferrugineus TaxID=354439 RepID=A0A834ITH5_RHYFE|nr:hypothetical protein GWI33_023413 [Rhynchophorus ferrugineus]
MAKGRLSCSRQNTTPYPPCAVPPSSSRHKINPQRGLFDVSPSRKELSARINRAMSHKGEAAAAVVSATASLPATR